MVYSDEIVLEVWNKATVVSDNDPNVWRKDECGAWIQRSMHGDRSSQYGWEIDCASADESQDLANLRPLQWQNIISKGDGKVRCRVTADGVDNREVTSSDETSSDTNIPSASASRNPN